MYIGLYVNRPLFLSDFNKTCIFDRFFEKTPYILNLMKIRSVEAELFQADERTDGQKDGLDEVSNRFP
jgi:hypothetical protein